MEKNKKIREANMISEEMHKLEAKRLREYAQAQIERERARKMNLKMSERPNHQDERIRRQHHGKLFVVYFM